MNLDHKKIVIFGLGVSGMGALRFLESTGAQLFAINQGAPSSWTGYIEVKKLCGEDSCFSQDNPKCLKLIEAADLIILSPGIPRTHELLRAVSAPIWNEVELASRFNKKPIIAITGTNGKTTTVSFLDHLFKAIGKKVFTGGNIGVAFCDHIRSKGESDYILLELSSFQLESLDTFCPEISVLLNIFPNHGERYSNNEDYSKAKFNIINNMRSGHLIYDSGNSVIKEWAERFGGKGVAIDTSKSDELGKSTLADFDLTHYKLPGIHNKINLLFSLEVLKALGLLKKNHEKVQEAINSFSGVAHRIEYIKSGEKFEAYNDAKSTNWDATITAVNAMSELGKELVLILGGKLRGHNDLPTEQAIKLLKERVKRILLIGESSDLLEKSLGEKLPCIKKGSIEIAVKDLKEEGFEGVLLLSPGYPSFDQFPNYVERGEAFKKIFSI